MLEKLRNAFLHAGADRTSLKRIAPKVRKTNRVMLRTLSAIAAILIGVMLVCSFFSEGLAQNRLIYLLGSSLSVVIFVMTYFLEKYDWLLNPLIYVACSIYYMYGILLGTITEPDGKTVTFVVMLVIMPIVFIEIPIRTALMTVFYDAIFICLCFHVKTGSLLRIDIIDGVLFGILGIATGTVINQMKVRGYVSEQKLQEISRVDLLTGVNNRNAYELDLFSISEKCRFNLACIYIDVNGLHEINNSEGHEFGDKMLKFIAEQIKEIFKGGFIYRVGGDEFVVFMSDKQIADLGYDVKRLTKRVEAKGYYIAIGYETMGARYLVIDDLVKAAEVRMSVNKEAYYEDAENRGPRKNQL